MKTDVVAAIRAAELQSPDPDTLAGRWSAITDIPIQPGPDGHPEMQLNNAVIRFVEAADGRGEGLGAIDIEASNPQQLLQAAEQRGLKISDTQMIICGTRFNLV